MDKSLLTSVGFDETVIDNKKVYCYKAFDDCNIEKILDTDYCGDETEVQLIANKQLDRFSMVIDGESFPIDTEKEFTDILYRLTDKEPMCTCDFCSTRVPEASIKRTHYGTRECYTRLMCPECYNKLVINKQ